MLMYEKKCGRKKARLVLQGFSEPFAWDNNESNYSPVAQLSSVRMLLARAGTHDVVTKLPSTCPSSQLGIVPTNRTRGRL